MRQSCAHARIDGWACEWGKKHYVSDAARTASLTDDGFFGQKSEVGIPTSVWRRLGRLEASMQVAWLRARSSEFFWALVGTYRNL